jgi:hypothetical protein
MLAVLVVLVVLVVLAVLAMLVLLLAVERQGDNGADCFCFGNIAKQT